ncbi:hypothetical protein BC332_21917 [Capsicum chinense]|nr:hypothetical protein BC332_21917 [Capsicum chinense]
MQLLNTNPFEVEYVQNISQQDCDSLIHKRRNASPDSVSENEDPPRPRRTKHSIPNEITIVRIGIAMNNYTYVQIDYIPVQIKMFYRNCLYYPSDSDTVLSTQQDYAEPVVVADNENAVNNIIKEFSIPAGLPWHLVDEVYVPMNCNQNFHWVLAVIALKDRLIRISDSLSNIRNMDSFVEIQKLALLNTNPFEVEYVQNISQQDCDSLIHKRRNASPDSVSENEDPPRPRRTKHSIPNEITIVRIG